MKRIFGNGSYANVTATLALVIALGGTSYAAIKLPKNSVTSAIVKDRSLLKKDFRPGQIPAGKRGPAGPAGPAGDAGAGGASGSSLAYFGRAEASENVIPGNADQTIQTLSLPAGNWVVTSKFVADNDNPDAAATGTLTCTLTLGGAAIDSLGPATDFDPGTASNTLTGAGTLAAPGAAAVVCNTSNSVGAGTYRARSITAVQAGSVAAG